MKVYALNLSNEYKECKYYEYLQCIQESRVKSLAKFKFAKDKVIGLYAELLVRYILSSEFGINNDNIKFLKNKYGKPYLGVKEKIKFNYSHSGDVIVCAFDIDEIGVDVEKVTDIDLAISEVVFSKDELKLFNLADESRKKEFFFELWTMKESYVKAKGEGLSIDLKSFSVVFDETLWCNEWSFIQYELPEKYKIAICSKRNKFPKLVHLVEIEDINEHFDSVITIY